MIVPVMAISNLVLTQQIYSEETNGAHAHYREPVPLMNQYSVAWFLHCDSPTCLFQLSLLLALCHVSQEKVSPKHKFDQAFEGNQLIGLEACYVISS